MEYGIGGFGLCLYWTDAGGNACDADLDLYVWEPNAAYAESPSYQNGQWYSPWMGQTTPNGFFSQDSDSSGNSEEYYVANEQIFQGDYLFVVNFREARACSGAQAHLLVFLPGSSEYVEINSENTGTSLQWPSPHQMDLSLPYSGTGCSELVCLNNCSDWWVPDSYYAALMRGYGALDKLIGHPITSKKDLLIFRYGKGFPAARQHDWKPKQAHHAA